MKTVGELTVDASGEREIVMTRDFNAPRALVWDCHTKPELVRRWLFGPAGWKMTTCTIDAKVGGRFRYEWRHQDGRTMGMGGVHQEIKAPERIVATQTFDEDWTGGEAIGTLVLTEQGGKTLLTNTILYSSKAVRDLVLQSPMADGVEAGYARIDQIAAG